MSHVSARLLKFINNEETEIIANRFNKFLVERYPEILKIRKLVGFPKPSGEARLVCVMGSLTKLYDISLKNRLESYIMPKIPKEQTAYQYDRRGCEENIFVTKILTEVFCNKLIMIVTDFSTAFNSVTNRVVYETLKALNMSSALLRATYEATDFFITTDQEGQSTEHFRGVPQVGTTSGVLLLAALFTLTERLNSAPSKMPLIINGNVLTHLLFADDCTLFALCPKDANTLFDIIENWSKDFGLPLHAKNANTLVKRTQT